ncbi:MAG TPA: RidA family protein [Pseudoflavonifractor sp.]|jgi:2-iminobutanoate/2-iminopropanoate deaminase|nr:RidA family protein [Pseudoflavonifractor sp.]
MSKTIISTANAPKAIGPYSQAISAGGLLITSGQLPIDPAIGKIVEGDIKAQTEQCFQNIEAILSEAGLTVDNIIKTTVFLADIADFAAMNEVYAQHITERFPARSAFQVAALPMGAKVEIETICAL